MMAVPCLQPVTQPLPSTVATLALLLVQVMRLDWSSTYSTLRYWLVLLLPD